MIGLPYLAVGFQGLTRREFYTTAHTERQCEVALRRQQFQACIHCGHGRGADEAAKDAETRTNEADPLVATSRLAHAVNACEKPK